MKTVLIVTTLSILVAAGASEKLDFMSFCYTIPNTESSLAAKSASVSYPGMTDVAKGSEVEIKIYKDSDNVAVHTYRVPEGNTTQPQIYRFALETAETGQYSAELCLKENGKEQVCSHRSAPSTQMETGKNDKGQLHQLTCKRDNGEGSEIDLTAELKRISGYASDAQIANLKLSQTTVLMRNGFTGNKKVQVLGSKKVAYFAVTYPVKDLRVWAMKNDKCKRKYLPVVLTYIVNKSTKMIVSRDRLSPYMPTKMYPTFLGLDSEPDSNGVFQTHATYKNDANLPDAPIEILVDVDALEENETYAVWHTACMLRKDGTENGITRCAEPFIEDFTYEGVNN